MKLNNRPNLLILRNLLKPAEAAAARLTVIEGEATRPNLADVVRHGLFVLAVAHVETMITDTLGYYLSVIPQKIEKEKLSVSKDELLAHQFDLVEVQIEKHLHELSYKSIDGIIEFFCSALTLDAKAEDLAAPLREIKATRNILLHNNLITNSAYLELAGSQRRANGPGVRLEITASYLTDSVATLLSFVAEAVRLIGAKYKDYTKLAATKRLWAFTFKSPVMPFEDFWIVDEENDCVAFRKKGKYEDGISGSETAFLNVWRAHFNIHAADLKAFTMQTLDSDNRAKLLYLLSVLRHFSIQ